MNIPLNDIFHLKPSLRCSNIPLTSSCQLQHWDLLINILFSIKDQTISNDK